LSVIRLAATIDCDARQYVPDTKADDDAQGRTTKYLETSVHGHAANQASRQAKEPKSRRHSQWNQDFRRHENDGHTNETGEQK